MTTLPPNARRHLIRVRALEPPSDLVDSIMAEVESTPQVRSFPQLRASATFAVAAAAMLMVAVLLRLVVPPVEPAATPVPLDSLPSAGHVENRIQVDPGDVPAAFGHGYLWLTNGAAGELVRLDPANGSIATPLRVSSPSDGVAIALTSTSVWVVDRRDSTLLELDPASLEERRRIPVDLNVDAIAADGPDLWLLDRAAGRLARLDTVGGVVRLSVRTFGSAVLVDGSVWVVDRLGSLARFDKATGQETGRLDLGVAPARLVPNGDSILVLGAQQDPIVVVDPASLRVLARGIPALAVAAEGGRVWAVVSSGHLARLDRDTVQPVAALDLQLSPIGTLAIGGGYLWATASDAAGDAYLLQIVPQP